ncbi:MAG: hypothetical protein JXA71_00095 [Chitinispirillaceae bacterium]|nr:hypothetical protein [Chitinispirillaceae bacterium]
MIIFSASLYTSSGVSNIDSLYYFYERTIYLEDLTQNAGWWANPSVIASVREPGLFTSNTGLLGGKYSISGFRLFLPLRQSLTVGFGLTGTSTTEGRSFSGDASGGRMTGSFSFSRPSLEAGAGYESQRLGAFGVLAMTGTESIIPDAATGIRIYYYVLGAGFGYLSPPLAGIRLSVSTLSFCHFQADAWWDHSAKTGVLVNINDSLVIASLEYGFSLQNTPFLGGERYAWGYEVIKGTVSTRFRSIAGFLLAYSTDTKNLRDNGPTFHCGLELRPSNVYAFWGGYEIGISPWSSRHRTGSPVITLLHRFWVGYAFRKNNGSR